MTHTPPVTIAFQEADPATAGMLQAVLSSQGYEAHSLPVIDNVDDIVAEVQLEVVLLDEKIIDISGEAVLNRLGENPATQAIPVLFFAGEALEAEAQKLDSDHSKAYSVGEADAFGLIDQIATIVREFAV